MGSTGVSPKRIAETDRQNDRVRSASLGSPASGEEGAPAAENAHSAELDQVERMEQLLTELEARSLALVPHGYWNQRESQSKSWNQWVVVVLVCIWLSILTVALAYLRYGQSSQHAQNDLDTAPPAISPPSDQLDHKMAKSVNRLAQAMANSADRLNRIEAALHKSNLNRQQLTKKMDSQRTETQVPRPEIVPVNTDNNVATLPSASRDGSQTSASTAGADPTAGSSTKPSPTPSSLPVTQPGVYQVLSVKPTATAIPHLTADGTVEYWLVPRGAFKDLHKVQPIAVTSDGVVIFSLEDGKKYLVTPKGEWRAAEW